MPHELAELWLDELTGPATGSVGEITADVCLIGLSGNAPEYKQPMDRNFGDIFPTLEPSGDLYFDRSHT